MSTVDLRCGARKSRGTPGRWLPMGEANLEFHGLERDRVLIVRKAAAEGIERSAAGGAHPGGRFSPPEFPRRRA